MNFNKAKDLYDKIMDRKCDIFSFMRLYGNYDQFITAKNIFECQTQEYSVRWKKYLETVFGEEYKDVISIDSYNGEITIELKNSDGFRDFIWMDQSGFQYNHHEHGNTFRIICFGKSDPIVFYLDNEGRFTDVKNMNLDTNKTPDNWTNEEWVMFRMCV